VGCGHLTTSLSEGKIDSRGIKMQRRREAGGRPLDIFEKVREYLGISQEAVSRQLGISKFTWQRWENGDIDEPSLENLRKLIRLIKKRSHKEFKRKFLEWVIYDKPIPVFGRTDEELIKEIEKNPEEFMKVPYMTKIFEERPELKGLPFREVYKRYTKGKTSLHSRVLLNMLPLPHPNKNYHKNKRPKKSLNIQRNKNVIKIKKTPREKHNQRNKSPSKKESGEDNSDGGSDEPPHCAFEKNFESKYNLLGFFDLLLKIDMRNRNFYFFNPKEAKKKLTE